MVLIAQVAQSGTVVFLGAKDEVGLVAGYARDAVVLDGGAYRFVNGYSDWYDHILGPEGYSGTWPDFRPEYEGDIYPGLSETIGGADFEISITLHPDSAPLAYPGGMGQRFGIYLQFDGGVFGSRYINDGAYLLFGFGANYGLQDAPGNYPFALVTPTYWTYHGAMTDVTGNAETITVRRKGDVFSVSTSSGGSNLKARAGLLTDQEVHPDLNGRPGHENVASGIGQGMELSAITLWGESVEGTPFPDGAARIQSIVVRSPALEDDVNVENFVPPHLAFDHVGDADADRVVAYEGTVADASTGDPIAKAVVWLVDGDRSYADVTDGEGRYLIRSLPGSYTLDVEARGYRGTSQSAQPGLDVTLTDIGSVLRVGSDYATLGEALEAANAGDVIELPPGTHRGPAELIPRVTIRGAGAETTRVVGEAYAGLVLRPFMDEFSLPGQPVQLRLFLPGLVMEGFTLDGGVAFPSFTAEEITDRLELLAAIDVQDVDGVRRSLEARPDLANVRVRVPDAGFWGMTYLTRAVHSHVRHHDYAKSIAMAELLIDAGAEINVEGGQNHCYDATALQCAAWVGNAPLVRYLLEAGADPNYLGRNHTPLDFVVEQGARVRDSVHALIDAGADYTMLHLVMVRSPRLKEEIGDRVNEVIIDHRGVARTVLEYAVTYRYTEIVEWLIEAGGDPTIANGEGRTPWDLAMERDTPQRIRAMLGVPGATPGG